MNVEPFIILFMLIKHKKLVLKTERTMRNLILFIFLTFFFGGSVTQFIFLQVKKEKILKENKTETCVHLLVPFQ